MWVVIAAALERGPMVEDLISLFESMSERSWAVGDRCRVRGQLARVDSIGPDCASVIADHGRMLFVGLSELTIET